MSEGLCIEEISSIQSQPQPLTKEDTEYLEQYSQLKDELEEARYPHMDYIVQYWDMQIVGYNPLSSVVELPSFVDTHQGSDGSP